MFGEVYFFLDFLLNPLTKNSRIREKIDVPGKNPLKAYLVSIDAKFNAENEYHMPHIANFYLLGIFNYFTFWVSGIP